jgi:hypothetical protein
MTAEDIRADLSLLYLDTAATGTDASLAPAVTEVPRGHLVYGADAGVPCSNEAGMTRNIEALRSSTVLTRRRSTLWAAVPSTSSPPQPVGTAPATELPRADVGRRAHAVGLASRAS